MVFSHARQNKTGPSVLNMSLNSAALRREAFVFGIVALHTGRTNRELFCSICALRPAFVERTETSTARATTSTSREWPVVAQLSATALQEQVARRSDGKRCDKGLVS